MNAERPIAAIEQVEGLRGELDYTPSLRLTHLAHRGGIQNVGSNTSNLILFKAVYHVYDVVFRTSGAMYGLAEHWTGGTTQGVYRSLDGGVVWTKLGDLVIDQAAGVWYEDIFVEPFQETLYLIKTNAGYAESDRDVVSFTAALAQLGTKSIGSSKWLSGHHNIDACPNPTFTERVVIFGEYNTGSPNTVSLWRTVDRGANWTEVLQQGANGTTGEIRHFHTVAVDQLTRYWWATSGDTDAQCKIWRSTDTGLTWELMFSGSQNYRTLGFVFESDAIYYGMDSQTMDPEGTKIFRIDRSDMSITEVGHTYNGYSVYGLTRCISPPGFFIWSTSEPHVSIADDRVAIEFYSYETEQVETVGYLSTEGLGSGYHGIQGASRHQDFWHSNIAIKPSISLTQGKFTANSVSRYMMAWVNL